MEASGKLLISSCIAGMPFRFDGQSKTRDDLVNLIRSGKAVHYCAEHLGANMPIPRRPAEIEPGKTAADVLDGKAKVLTDEGEDVTEAFILGANRTLDFCQKQGVTIAVLKEKSPSCGSQKIYDGNFDGNTLPGRGVTAELLIRNGIRVISDEEYLQDSEIKALIESIG